MNKRNLDSEWAIIGGGIHGCHIAIMLVAEGLAKPDEICIIDPQQKLLANWQELSARVKMSHLRSPGVHHIAPNPLSLLHMYKKPRKRHLSGHFSLPNSRPSLEIFNRHCDTCLDEFGLTMRHVKNKARQISSHGSHYAVSVDDGSEIISKKIVLALGATNDTLCYPDWAGQDVRESGRVKHIFEEKNSSQWLTKEGHLLIVGAGISAAQLAVHRASKGLETSIIKRKPLFVNQLDSDACWIGPKCLAKFDELSPAEKRSMITKERNNGSIPPAIAAKLRSMVRSGALNMIEDEVLGVSSESDELVLSLKSGNKFKADHVALACGFTNKRPGGQLVDRLIKEQQLPTGTCGFPILDASLQWSPGLFVTGLLAELELGPLARNIVGARMAAVRIADVS